MSLRVLIADDDAAVREALSQAIAADRDLVLRGAVGDGREAFELAGRTKVDVIVLDIAMPEMTGLEAARALRASGSKVPIVFFSGEDGSREEAESIPRTAFVSKRDGRAQDVLELIKKSGLSTPGWRVITWVIKLLALLAIPALAMSIVLMAREATIASIVSTVVPASFIVALFDLIRRSAVRSGQDPLILFARPLLIITAVMTSALPAPRCVASAAGVSCSTSLAPASIVMLAFPALYALALRRNRRAPMPATFGARAKKRRRGLMRDAGIRTKITAGFVLLPLLIGTGMSAFLLALFGARAADSLRADALTQMEIAKEFLTAHPAHRVADIAAGSISADDLDLPQTVLRARLAKAMHRRDIDFMAVLDERGRALATLARGEVAAGFTGGPDFAEVGDRLFETMGGDLLMVGATWIRGASEERVGTIVAGRSVDVLLEELSEEEGATATISVYDVDGNRVADASGIAPSTGPTWPSQLACEDSACHDRLQRENRPTIVRPEAGDSNALTVLAPWDVRWDYTGDGRQPFDMGMAATFWVNQTTTPMLAAVGAARIALGFLVAVLIAALLVAGRLLARVTLRQVTPLLQTTRALGEGKLSARSPVLTSDELGELAGSVNTMAERLQAQTGEAERLYTELSDAMRSKEVLFRNFAHELRTPLQVIRGNAELAGRGASDILAATDDLSTLVDEILDLVRLEAGRADIELAPTDLGHILAALTPTIDGLAAEAGVRATTDFPPAPTAVLADERRLLDLIRNLVSNAAKYTPEGGSIGVRAKAIGRQVLIEVWDTGVGIPRAHQAEVFQPFRQIEGITPFRGQPSSGLGLAIAASIADAHGTTLRLTSAPGEGSTFSFTLDAVEVGS